MSLLHNALKKAEKENAPESLDTSMGGEVQGDKQRVFVDRASSKQGGASPLRVYVLVSLIVISLSVLVYGRYYKGGMPAISLPRLSLSSLLNLKKAPAVVLPTPVTPIPAPVAQSSPTPANPVAPAAMPTAVGASGPADEVTRQGSEKLILGEFDKARLLFEQAVILQPQNAENYNNLGLALKKMGRNDEAFEQYRRAISIDAQCAECFNNLGVLLLSNRELEEAESHFKKAADLKPAYADPYLHLGLVLEARGDVTGAKASYKKYMELAKGVKADLLLKVQKKITSLQPS